MPRSSPRAAGLTTIELMTVVAIVGVVAALAMSTLSRARPRANLSGAAVELHALLHGARQQALATGMEVAVMIFPAHPVGGEVVGRIIVYQDGDSTLFDAVSPERIDEYKPALLTHGPRSEIVTTMDLPPAVRFGPAEGMGKDVVLPAPWSAVPVNLDCTFCEGDGEARRGAVVFDGRGRARFYSKAGAPLAVDGGSVSLEVPALGAGGRGQVRTLVVGGSTGAVRALNNG